MSDRELYVGVLPQEEVRKLSGRELLEGIIEGRYPAPPISQVLPFRLVEVGDGWAAFEGEASEALHNIIGVIHGGFAMTILDSVLACAVMSRLPAGVGYTTLETKVNFLRPVTANSGRLRAEANAVHVGRRTGVAEGRIMDGEGRVLAFGTSTLAVLEDRG